MLTLFLIVRLKGLMIQVIKKFSLKKMSKKENYSRVYPCLGCAKLNASTKAGDSALPLIIDLAPAIITQSFIGISMDAHLMYQLMT